ncbi:MAG: glycosyltransferase family 39 protein [Planctomycetota bacterium]
MRALAAAPKSAAPVGVCATRTSRWPVVAALVLLPLATCLAYLPAFGGAYFWDDDAYLTGNPLIRQADGWWKFWALRYSPRLDTYVAYTSQYYPVVYTSYWLEYRLWGLNPVGYHAVSILFHALNAILVYFLCRRLRLPACGLIAGLVAVHPVMVESVAWVAERKNIYSAFFALLTTLAWLKFLERGWWRTYALCIVLFALGLVCKPVICTLPAVLLLLAWGHRGAFPRREALLIGPFLVIGALPSLLTMHAEQAQYFHESTPVDWDLNLFERTALLAPRALTHYAWTILWPANLMTVYPRWQVDPSHARLYLFAAGWLIIIIALVLLRKRTGAAPLALLAATTALLSTMLGLADCSYFRHSFVADHFVYHAAVGFFMLYVLAGHTLLKHLAPPARVRSVGAGLGALTLVILGALTFRDTLPYRTAESYWETALAKNPNAWVAMVNLETLYANAGRHAEADALFRRAQEFPMARYITGPWLTPPRADQAPPEAARMLLSEAEHVLGGAVPATRPVAQDKTLLLLRRQLADCLAAGRTRDARTVITAAVRLAPHDLELRLQKAALHVDLSEYSAAIAEYRAVLDADAGSAAAQRGLALALAKATPTGDPETPASGPARVGEPVPGPEPL